MLVTPNVNCRSEGEGTKNYVHKREELAVCESRKTEEGRSYEAWNRSRKRNSSVNLNFLCSFTTNSQFKLAL